MDTTANKQTIEQPTTGLGVGIWRGLSNESYHSDQSAVSSSGLKRLLRSPAHFKLGGNGSDESSDALAFGTAFHMALLEPDKYAQVYTAKPVVDRRTKAGKALAAVLDDALADRVLISRSWMDEIEHMVGAARGHPQVASMLATGEAEVSYVWQDGRALCKVRPDWLNENAIWDVKTCVDASWSGFSKACARFGYALSAAMYQEGVYRLTGEKLPFRFVACEKGAPFAVAVYEASEGFLRAGRKQFEEALKRLQHCRETNVWPGYQAEGWIEYIDLPGWAK